MLGLGVEVKMKLKLFLLLIPLLFILPVVHSTSDEEVEFLCMGDEEVKFYCDFGWDEILVEVEEEEEEVEERPRIAPQRTLRGCGDNICETAAGENYTNCPEDCDAIDSLIAEQPELEELTDSVDRFCSFFLKLINFIAQFIRNIFLKLNSLLTGTDAPIRIIPDWDAMPTCRELQSFKWLVNNISKLFSRVGGVIYG